MSDYRNKFIKAYPGMRIPGYPGYWYRCVSCGRLCGRPGMSGAVIPEHMRMEVDHIVPWSLGGADTLDNLQPMCKPCNRMKGNMMDSMDIQIAYQNAMRKGKQFKIKKRRKARSKSSTGGMSSSNKGRGFFGWF